MHGRPKSALSAALAAMVLVPSAAGAVGGARERGNDTRDQASAWARQHIPPGSTIAVEHLALDLRSHPWTILFPLGAAGCIDGRDALRKGVSSDQVQRSRQESAIVDLGTVSRGKLATCAADYAILTYFDLYQAEQGNYPVQIDTYRALLKGGRTVALFRPERGRSAGPVTRIVAIKPQNAS